MRAKVDVGHLLKKECGGFEATQSPGNAPVGFGVVAKMFVEKGVEAGFDLWDRRLFQEHVGAEGIAAPVGLQVLPSVNVVIIQRAEG